jgi:hypothetical protein
MNLYFLNLTLLHLSKPSTSDGEKPMNKLEMLQSQSKCMATMAFCFFTTFKILNIFLANKVGINNERLNKVKINNLKIVKKLGVIIEEEFKIGVDLETKCP